MEIKGWTLLLLILSFIYRASSADFQKKYESERLRSESYLFKWKEVESYKSYAEQQERLKVEAEQKLEQYQS